MKYYSESQVGAVADVLKKRGVIALKGDNAYYLVCNALDEEVVQLTLSIRKKPQDNPLVLYMANIQMVERYVPNISHQAFKLADSLWPCSMVMLLPVGKEIPENITCGLGATGICCPTSKFIREISCLLNKPVIMVAVTFENFSFDDPNIDGIVEYSPFPNGDPVVFDARGSLRRIQPDENNTYCLND